MHIDMCQGPMPAVAQQSLVQALNQVRDLLKAGDAEGGLALLQNLRPKQLARPVAQILLASVQFQLGRSEAALAVIESVRRAGVNSFICLQLQARIQDRIGDGAGAAQTRKELLECFPNAAGIRYQLGLHHLHEDDLDAAEACASTMPPTTQGLELKLSLLYQIAVRRADPQEIARVLNRIIAECDTCPRLPEQRMFIAELPAEVRQDLTDRMITKWPALANKLLTGRVALDPSRPVGSASERAMVLALTGQAEEAMQLLATHRADDPAVCETEKLVSAMPRQAALQRPLITDDGSDVIASPMGMTGTTVLVFTGLNDRSMVPIEYVDRFCAAAGHSAIYLRDSGRTLYVDGVPSLAQDLDGTLAALQDILRDKQTSRLLCFGSSAGGFGAIRYGLRLGAERVLCASSPTNGNIDFLTTSEEKRGRMLIKRMVERFPPRVLDFREDLLAEGQRPRLDLWYGADFAPDVAHASYLEGYPGVHLHSIDGLDRHNSFASVVALGGLQEFLE
jgi:pimeloyl-ACP methyl ester carboxylesterase